MALNNNITQEEFEHIEAYLNHQLKDDALLLFEKRLENEVGFKAKVEVIETIILGIETQALKEQLNQFHESIDTPTDSEINKVVNIRSSNWKYLSVAAAFVIALTGFWFFSGSSNDRLYADYFTVDPGLPTTMSSNSNYEFYHTMVTYKQGDYGKAIAAWQTQLLKKPENDTLNYFIGVAKLANKNEKDAISYLKKVSEAQASAFKNDAYFYLGLAYLKLNQNEQAIAALKQSSIPESEALIQKLK